jgi:hypothetical protein
MCVSVILTSGELAFKKILSKIVPSAAEAANEAATQRPWPAAPLELRRVCTWF